jgi:hypothetical protein
MSRDSSGNYSLPAGNPVITGTTVSSTWANITMNDLGAALTDSLSRSGLGSMTAGLKLADGTSGLPGLTWALETDSGIYRDAAGDFRWVISSAELLRLNSNMVQLSGTAPIFRLNESDASTDNKVWDAIVTGEQLALRALTDALVATNWLTVDRTAGVIDTINFPNGTLQYGGVEVGYRGVPGRAISGSSNTAATDNGTTIAYTASGGHTFTIDTDLSANGSIVTIINVGSGNLTIAETLAGNLMWLAGSGSLTTGSRILGVGGIAVVYRPSYDSNNAYIWGAGLS